MFDRGSYAHMALFDAVSLASRAFRLVMRLVAAITVTAVGWLFVRELVAAGQLPPRPLGLASMGSPATLFGLPTAYAAGIALFAALVLFGGSGGSGAHAGVGDAHAGEFGDGGGFGGGGDGGGGNGGGGGGE
jgi:hypothetical protein